MEIRKHYDIGELAEHLKEAIERPRKYHEVVKLDVLTAYNILDVLEETHKREQKHQTLESAITFIEKEDGTQTNLMEEGKKIAKVMTTEQKTEHCGCFGKYDEDDLDCLMCGLMCACSDERIKERSRGRNK